MFNINFADDWSRTADLWYQKQPLYQLSHNHFPVSSHVVMLESCLSTPLHTFACHR